ncbi:YeiH family protein [Pimelobacter simplex]|uniref:YeiH family protein n=1 Tax=Nocardioides simplex TaxID=2045 RepID=UPI0021505933|nr:putative sulfate exporter family transporter [Pimelobacter simplex]UUW87219.1 putative sulfate exporter family transporter [Pimelobacter simplex]UUW96725.1 putative sulfate exporter family transporter [Pimelobacter simplex]
MITTRLRAPGVAFCAAPALLAFGVGRLVPAASPLLVAIALGMVAAAVVPLGEGTAPGIAFSARTLLRAGVVLLGLQLSLRQVAALGPGVIALVLAVVASGVALTMALGARLGLSWTHRLLIGCGFSICGAAAVAAVDGVVEADEDETASAVALVVVFGTAMIGLVPLVASLLDLSPTVAGIWAGASVHEVAQVVAAGGVVGGGALAVAVVVKLGRVLLLAPVVAWVSWQRRTTADAAGGVRPALVPGFVLGFLALVLLRTWITPPAWVLDTAAAAQTLLLAAAMFALGCGVRLGRLRAAGAAPFLLAAFATGWVGLLGLGGALLVG